MRQRQAPGFFGKIPSHGDFVARRLPPAFTERWDAWLQAGMADSRSLLGDDWLPIYLNSPIWRFALDAGVCGPHACYGVIMPSVDRVGRYFPFTIAAAGCQAPPAAWYAALESLALSALDAELPLQHHDAALLALDAPLASGDRLSQAPTRECPGGAHFWLCDATWREQPGPVLYQDCLAAPLFSELLLTSGLRT